ncbi:MAG: hypothetical protein QM571_05455 [Micrococcaceae bacterium]
MENYKNNNTDDNNNDCILFTQLIDNGGAGLPEVACLMKILF